MPETVNRVILVDSEAIAARGALLFPGALTVYANGKIPPEAAGKPDAVVVSADRARIEALCAQLVAAQCKLVREWERDISAFTTREEIVEAQKDGRLIPYSAPQAEPLLPVPQDAEAEPAGADPLEDVPPPDEYPPGIAPLDEDADFADIAEIAAAGVRNASANKREAHSQQRDDWPEPEEDFSDSYELPEFDPAWIPPPLRDFVLNVHHMQGCDLGIPAMHALTVAAGLITDDIKVAVKRQQEWYESPRIWSCVLGRSGDGKSPALRAVMRETKALSIEIAEASKKRMADYKLDMEVYEAQKRIYVQAKAKGEPATPLGPPPERPVDEQLYFDDTNTEGIADVLQQSSRGSMLVNDELLGWLSGFDRYRAGGDRQFYLETWDGGERVFNRVGRKWIIKACGLSICGNSQPTAIQRAVAKMGLENDGLIQRVLIYNSLRDAAAGSEIAADHEAIKRWRRISYNLYHLKTNLDHCFFSPQAQELYRQAEIWISETRGYAVSEAAQEHLSKYRGYLARIALTMHCIDCADAGRPAVSPEIHQDTLARAWSLLRDCLYPHAMKFYGEIAGDTTRKKAMRQITNFIICRPDLSLTLRRRDFELQCREAWYPEAPGSVRDSIRRDYLNELIGMGWIRPVGMPDRIGKLPANFEVNPKLDAKFADVRAVELPKRQAVRQRLEEQKAAKRERQAGED